MSRSSMLNALLRLRRATAMLTVLACVAVCAAPGAATGEPLASTTSISLVRDAADYGWRSWLRTRVVRADDAGRYGLRLDSNWQEQAADLPLVVLVHGFNSNVRSNRAVLEQAHAQGFPCGGFAYPNDHSVVESAALLSRELHEFAESHPRRRVTLVTHSMGGLVARACLEEKQLDPGNVDRLIMIAPPNHGTHIAHAAVATDVWEHWLGRRRGGCWARWRDSVVDGLGEAADDLVPESPFLQRLNRRQRNSRVRYTIFLGTDAAVEQEEMAWIRGAVQKTGGRMPGVRSAANKIDGWLEDMDEIVDGRGDGVVAVKRGMLEGVDDVVVLPFGHLSVTAAPRNDAVRRVHQELTARLN